MSAVTDLAAREAADADLAAREAADADLAAREAADADLAARQAAGGDVAAREFRVPTGVVTFLFTDIEGSTALLQRLGHAHATAVFEAHDRVLGESLHRNGGIEVRAEGDSFFFAFERPSDAVAAAIAANRALGAYPWPPGGDVRVRIGMHAGEAAVTRSGYVGLAVHRAARITGLARGGQVLLSRTTRDLVVDALSPRAALVDLGEHHLKDFPEPQQIYELVHPTLATSGAS